MPFMILLHQNLQLCASLGHDLNPTDLSHGPYLLNDTFFIPYLSQSITGVQRHHLLFRLITTHLLLKTLAPDQDVYYAYVFPIGLITTKHKRRVLFIKMPQRHVVATV